MKKVSKIIVFISLLSVLFIAVMASNIIFDTRNFPMNVSVSVSYQGQDYIFDYDTTCMAFDKTEGLRNYTIYRPDPYRRGFGMRMPDNSAILVMVPPSCGQRKKQDGSIEYTQLKDNEFPIMGYLKDADQRDQILLYTSPRAHKEGKGPFKLNEIVLSKPKDDKFEENEFSWFAASNVEGYSNKRATRYDLIGVLPLPELNSSWGNDYEQRWTALHNLIDDPSRTQSISSFDRLKSRYVFNALSIPNFRQGSALSESEENSWRPSFFDAFPLETYESDSYMINLDRRGFAYMQKGLYFDRFENSENAIQIKFPNEMVSHIGSPIWVASEKQFFRIFVFPFYLQHQ